MTSGRKTAGAGVDAVVGLGSNIGDTAANIRRANALLTADGDISLVAA